MRECTVFFGLLWGYVPGNTSNRWNSQLIIVCRMKTKIGSRSKIYVDVARLVHTVQEPRRLIDMVNSQSERRTQWAGVKNRKHWKIPAKKQDYEMWIVLQWENTVVCNLMKPHQCTLSFYHSTTARKRQQKKLTLVMTLKSFYQRKSWDVCIWL